jgi:misacylated tRNA(Ala) deacylase
VTEELFSTDAYVRSCKATVTAVTDGGVVLDRTVFYARGGGQPGDSGVLRWDGGECRIADTVRSRETGEHLHVPAEGEAPPPGAKVTGGNMESGGIARMDFELDAMSQELGRDVEERLNALLAEDRPVRVLLVPRAEAFADPDLIRTKVNLIPEGIDPIRVIDIEGIDKQADGGTHVRSTGEVGRVRVVKTESKGRANKRMRIQLEGV